MTYATEIPSAAISKMNGLFILPTRRLARLESDVPITLLIRFFVRYGGAESTLCMQQVFFTVISAEKMGKESPKQKRRSACLRNKIFFIKMSFYSYIIG
jgi:hypothetical protein